MPVWVARRVAGSQQGRSAAALELSGLCRRYRTTLTYFQIVNGVKQYPAGAALRYITSVNDNYSQGKSLSDAQVQAIVQRAIAGGGLGRADPNGMYFVLTSQARRPLQPLIRSEGFVLGKAALPRRRTRQETCVDEAGSAP